MTSNSVQLSPSYINLNGYTFQSPKIISNLMKDFYMNKIKDIRSGFSTPKVDPISILKHISSACSTVFKIPYISVDETRKLILSQKNSASTGYDSISNKIIRKIAPEIAPIIAHLINSIIRTGIFPDCLKISKVIPILKSGKEATSIESYRPVNCLPCIEKLAEEWIKLNLVNYFESNNLINPNHHGERKGFSTVSAKSTIENILHKNFKDNMITGVLNFDLSSCFETIDHKGQKLNFMGLRDKN